MKRLIRHTEDVFCMSKLSEKYVDMSVTGKVHGYIYFSECNDSHGPRIKFYGGNSKSKNTKDAPSMSFSTDGEPELVKSHSLNSKDYPYAFDNSVVSDVKNFIKRNRPLLLLVWFRRLDEADLLEYFCGRLSFEDLLRCIDCPDGEIQECDSMKSLHETCKLLGLYKF